MKTSALFDEITGRIKAMQVEAVTFEEQRILLELYEGLCVPETRIAIKQQDRPAILIVVGGVDNEK